MERHLHRAPVINIAKAMEGLSHGTQTKHMFVSHETVSYNAPGLSDILGVERVLHDEGYGIHGLTDREAHMCWTKGMGKAVFWHAGDVNGVAVGVENISEIPILIQSKKITHAEAHAMWMERHNQLSALAILIACWHNVDPVNHPIRRSTGKIESPGVCSHWDVSRWYASSGGHWDCWPVDQGGYFPLAHVIALAKVYAKHYRF